VTPPRRLQSPTERDLESDRERRKREAIPVEFETEDEDFTGQCARGEIDTDELAKKRADRSDKVRIEKLEAKADQTATSLIRLEAKVDTVVGLLTGKSAEEGKTARTKITVNGKVLIAVVTSAIAMIGTVLALVLK
jgi:hypothetical protein